MNKIAKAFRIDDEGYLWVAYEGDSVFYEWTCHGCATAKKMLALREKGAVEVVE